MHTTTAHETPPRTYTARDCGGSETQIQAKNDDEAIEAVRAWVLEGDWDAGGCAITVSLFDADGDDVWRGDVDVPANEVAIDPHGRRHKERGHSHAWHRPVALVGGCDQNPGVWSTGGAGIVTVQVCACGAQRESRSAGGRRDPGQPAVRIAYTYPAALWPWGDDATRPGSSWPE